MGATSEVHRQLVHIGVGGLAFLLRDLTWWQAALGAAAAVVANRFVLLRAMPGLFRSRDRTQPWQSGIVLYPLAVLALILLFRTRLDLAAVAWAILAAGDGAATLVGAHVRTTPLPWNPRKTTGGLIAFVLCGAAAAVGVYLWTTTRSDPAWWLIALPVTTAIVAAAAETAPIALDDNITVPVAAALALATLSLVDPSILAGAMGGIGPALIAGAAVNSVVAGAGWAVGTVTVGGAVTGAAIGTAIVVGAGWPGWSVLLAAFIMASAMTKAGFARKAALGIAEARGGRRGPANAIANTGVAAWLAVISLGLADPSWAHLGVAAALVAGASDTVASEVGKAWGRTTVLLAGLRRVPPGTSGAMSLEGTLGGALAAAGLAAVAWTTGLIPPAAIGVVTAAAVLASIGEGVLGARFESSGILDNDALNVVTTILGAGLALVFWPLV